MSAAGHRSFYVSIDRRVPLVNERLMHNHRLSPTFREFYRVGADYLMASRLPRRLQLSPGDTIHVDIAITCHPLTDEDAPLKALWDLLGRWFVGPDEKPLGDNRLRRGEMLMVPTRLKCDMKCRLTIRIPESAL